MANQPVLIGTIANDGTGDPLRTAFQKVNSNFGEVYAGTGLSLPGPMFNVKAFGAIGNGVVDDRAAIIAAQTAAQAVGGAAVYFPRGTYAVSDYIDVGASTIWIGDSLGDVAGIGNATLKATGVNSGILRARPGTIGQVNPVLRELHLIGLGFTGGATTGHLVTIARWALIRATACYFNNTSGQGLKDDQSTLTGAAGVYLFGTNSATFINCNWENNLAATNGAGVTMETGVNITSFWNCQFNNNTIHHRLINANASMNFHSTNFVSGGVAHKADNGGQRCFGAYQCWYELQTAAADPTGIVLQFSGNAKNEEITFQGCSITGPLADTHVHFVSAWIVNFISRANSIFHAAVCYNFSNAPAFTRQNREESNLYGNVSNIFQLGNVSPADSGFITSDNGQVVNPHLQFTLTDAATIAVDASAGDLFTVTLAGNRAVGLPTNPRKAQRITFTIIQDGTGGRTLTWNAVFKVSWSDAGNTLNKRSSVSFWYDGTNWNQDGAQAPYV